jgi:hypothetical protein
MRDTVLVLCARVPEARIRPVSQSQRCGCHAFTQFWVESQNEKKCDNFEELPSKDNIQSRQT